MGIFAVTGGSGGIGAKTIALLKKKGHETINIDLKKGEIEADLSTPEGRQKAIDELHALSPEGLDGLVCSAGVSGSCGNLRQIVAVNFFGVTSLVKGGACVVTASNTISQGNLRMDLADLLNNNSGDEQRILNLLGRMNASSLETCESVYVASKYALARWMRRHSASYAANGVRINAVAPGNVNAAMTATMSTTAKMALNALPIPTKYGRETLMSPDEVAHVIVFLISPESRGVNGVILFVDGGTDALLNTEKVY